MIYKGIEFTEGTLTIHTSNKVGNKKDFIFTSDNWRNETMITKVIKRKPLQSNYINTEISTISLFTWDDAMNKYIGHTLKESKIYEDLLNKNCKKIVLHYLDQIDDKEWMDSEYEIDLHDTKMNNVEVKDIT